MRSLENAIGAFIVSHRRPWEYFCNAVLGLNALLFTYGMFVDFFAKHRASSLYVAVFEAAVVLFAVSRPMPKESNRLMRFFTTY